MKTGIGSSAYFDKFGVEKGSYLAREHGYDCFDYGNFTNTDTDFFRLPEAEFERILISQGKSIAENGMLVSQVHGPWRHPARDFTPEDRGERFDCMSKAIRGAAYLGSENMVIHCMMPFGTNTAERPDEMKAINLEYFNRLCDVAEKYGITVCLENLPFLHLPINSPAQVLDFVKSIDRKSFKICLDTGHSLVAGTQPADAVSLIGKDFLRVMHVHDNDGRRDLHQIPGCGIGNWQKFSKALHDIGFDGTVSLETSVSFDNKTEEQWDIEARELAKFARRIANGY